MSKQDHATNQCAAHVQKKLSIVHATDIARLTQAYRKHQRTEENWISHLYTLLTEMLKQRDKEQKKT